MVDFSVPLNNDNLISPYGAGEIGSVPITYKAIDIRQFSSSVGIGNETADTKALDLAWAEAVSNVNGFPVNGSASSGTPFKIVLPSGQFKYGGSGFTSGVSNFRGAFAIEGQGMAATRLQISSNIYMIDVDASVISTDFRGFQVNGTTLGSYKGFYRNRRTGGIGGNSGGGNWVQQVQFSDYAVCALSSSSSDDPNWRILGNKFTGTDASKAMCVPPGGNQNVFWNWINKGTYGIHVRAGKDFRLWGNRFGGLAGPLQRYDIYIELVDAFAGQGAKVWGNYAGNESDNATDIDVLFADGDNSGGTDYGAYGHSTAVSSNIIRGISFHKNAYTRDAGRTRGIYYSYTPNIAHSSFDDVLVGAANTPYLVEFDSAITTLGVGNKWPQTNYVNISQGGFGGNVGIHGKVSNLPGFGVAVDPAGVFPGDMSIMPNALPLVAPTDLITETMNNFASVADVTISAAETDPNGGTDARTLTFTASNGRGKLEVDEGNINLAKGAWLSFSVGAASSQTMPWLQIVVGTTSGNFFWSKYVAVPTSGFASFRYWVQFPSAPANLRVLAVAADGWVSGSADKVKLALVKMQQY